MDQELWSQIDALLDALIERTPDERAAYLDAQDVAPAVRAQVETLLGAYDRADDFLEDSVASYAAVLAADVELEGDALLGEHCGDYRLVEQLGRGGMGMVFRAEHVAPADEPDVPNEIAIKLVRRGLDTDDILQRFAAERHILKRLQHPGIARFIDAGATRDGRPYLVMELVDGVPISRYCAEHRCSVNERVALVEQVARAVHHAHRNLIVHRDLKPANIFIVEEPDGPQVKLLDFGIARLLADDASTAYRSLTRTGAPEQVQGGDVTTATDVHALGAVLHELLAGAHPFRRDERSRQEVERAICHEAPPALHNRSSQALPAGPVDGDLDLVVQKALRKEPERRYASAEALADDLQRYREGRPVTARPSTLGYRLRKFASRHRQEVALASVSLLLLIGYVVTVQVQAQRIAQERNTAEAVTSFLVDMFEQSDPNASAGDTLTVRAALSRGAERVRTELAEQPRVRGRIMTAIARVYHSIGRYDEARALATEALNARRGVLGPHHLGVAATLNLLGDVAFYQSRYAEADSLFRRVVSIRTSHLGPRHVDVAGARSNRGVALLEDGQFEAAEAELEAAHGILRDVAPNHDELPTVLDNLARLAWRRSDYARAEALMRRSLALARQQYGTTDHKDVSTALNNLALVLDSRGQHDEALRTYQASLDMQTRLFGERHPEVLSTLGNIGLTYYKMGRFAAAAPRLERVMQLTREVLGPDHPGRVIDLNNYASLLRDQGRYTRAVEVFRQAQAKSEAVFGPQHPIHATVLTNLARALHRQGGPAEAGELYRASLTIQEAVLDADHPDRALNLHGLGALARERGDFDRARRLLDEAVALQRQAFPEGHPQLATALQARARLYMDAGELAAAEPLFREAVQQFETTRPAKHWQTLRARHWLGLCRAAQGKVAETRRLLATTQAAIDSALGAAHPVAAAMRARSEDALQ